MNELDKLREMLKKANIPFESYQELYPALTSGDPELEKHFQECSSLYGECGIYSRNQVIYGMIGENDWKIDGICQFGSYGAADGLIETFGRLGVDKDGDPMMLTAEEVFEIIKTDYDKENLWRW